MNNISQPTELRAALGECVTAIDVPEHLRRLGFALSLGLPSIIALQDSCLGETIDICASGPSMKTTLPHIPADRKTIAVNACHDFMASQGRIPTYGCLLDPNEWVSQYQTPRHDVTYLVGSPVHPKVWQRFREADVQPYLYCPIYSDQEMAVFNTRVADEIYPDAEVTFVAGWTTIGMRAINLAAFLGAANVGLHGFDSCCAPGGVDLHSHSKPVIYPSWRRITVRANSDCSLFTCVTNAAMARQITSFDSFTKGLGDMIANGRVAPIKLRVYGDGAIPWMAWKGDSPFVEHGNPDAMRAKYGDSMHWDYETDGDLMFEEFARAS